MPVIQRWKPQQRHAALTLSSPSLNMGALLARLTLRARLPCMLMHHFSDLQRGSDLHAVSHSTFI